MKFEAGDDKILPMANQLVYQDYNFNSGDLVRVHHRLIEREKKGGKTKKDQKVESRERIQVFEGIVTRIHGRGENKNFTVRRLGVGGIGIERIFPIVSPWIAKIEVKKKGHVRRARIDYIRDRSARSVSR